MTLNFFIKRIVLLLCAISTSVCAEWTVLKDCRMVENQFNDADSFIVESKTLYRGEMKNRFRLYFVDSAETDASSKFEKDRVLDQAKYWGSTDPDFAMKMGLRAEQQVKRLLCGGFDVYTQGEYAPTLGAPRYYALVKIKDRWLDEILVEGGLARIYGKGTNLPDGTDAKMHWRTLYAFEHMAKSKHQNGWLGAVGEKEAPKTFEPYDAVVQSSTWIYSTKDGRRIMMLRKGTTVTVVSSAEGSRMCICFKKNGKVYEGLCKKSRLK